MMARLDDGPPAGEPRSPWRLVLSLLLAAAVVGAVAVAVMLNLPVRPPTGLTSPSGTAAAPDIVAVARGRVVALRPMTALRGRPAVAADFVDATAGWAIVGCGGARATAPCSVARTTDGGFSWRIEWTTSQQLAGIAFPNARDGYAWTGSRGCANAVCPTRLFATTDGGRTWTLRFASAAAWSSIAVTGPSSLWAVVGGVLAASSDGGRYWRTVATPGCIPQSVRFRGRSGVVVGSGGAGVCALASGDGGGVWRPLLTGLDAPSVAPAFTRFIADSGLSSALGGPASVQSDCAEGRAWPQGGGSVWLVVRCSSINPDMLAILYTADGGAHWRLAWDTAGCTGACPAHGMGEDPLGFLGRMAWRTAPGAVATATAVGAPFHAGGRLCAAAACTPALQVLSAERAVAATAQGVFATLDGGRSWQRLWPAAGPGPLASVSLLSAGTGLAVADLDPGRILRSDDGGHTWRTWARLPGGFAASLLDFVSTREGYVYGTRDGHPALLATDDGGRTFRAVPLPASQGGPLALSRVAFRTALSGLVLDVFGNAWRTSDGGRHWQLLAPMPLGLPQAAAWTGPRTLFALVAFKPAVAGRGASGPGHYGLVESADGAAQFRPLAAWPWPPAAGQFDSAVLAARGQSLWLFAYDGMLASSDGGAFWTLARLPPSRLAPIDLAFADDRSGWLLSARGALFATSDGGTTWRQVTRLG